MEGKPLSTRIDGIDLLRGLSIFLVLMNHVHMRLYLAGKPYTEGLSDQLVSTLVWGGQRGVQIFFCVSGFLITSTSLRRWGSLGALKPLSFYWLRIARIAPLLVALLLNLSALHFAGVTGFVIGDKTGGLGAALFAALTFRINVLEASRGYLPPNWDILWSLSVEETFYLFFPLLCATLGGRKAFLFVLAGFVALGPFARSTLSEGNEVWREYSYLVAMDAIALGALTAFLSAKFSFSRDKRRILLALGFACLAVSLGASRWIGALGLTSLGLDMTILALGECCLIFTAAQSRWACPRALLPLRKLGERSYEIYLTHMFVILALLPLFQSSQTLAQLWPFFLAAVLGSFALGEVVGRYFSEPANAWLRRRSRPLT